MATRSHTSFKKRQKELLRIERQKEKAARRIERKNAPKDDGIPELSESEGQETPLGEDLDVVRPAENANG